MIYMNYYNILGIKSNATKKEIKNSYFLLAKKYHPDKNLDNKEWAEEKFKNITEAYHVLYDDELRKKYDKCNSDGIISGLWKMKNYVEEFMVNNKDMIDDLKGCKTKGELKGKILYYSLKYFFT